MEALILEEKAVSKDTLVLKDESILELEAGAGLSDMRVKVKDAGEMAEVFGRLTDGNLSRFTVKNSKGVVAAVYEHCTLAAMNASPLKDGIMCSISIREKSDTELRLEQLEQEVGQLTGKTEPEKEE